MLLTGERTMPGIWHENYWFRRHEAVYAAVPGLVVATPAAVLDAGSGEGYGCAVMARRFPGVVTVGVDYDDDSTVHATRAHGGSHTAYVRGLLTALPLASGSADLVVSLQVIEHIWNPDQYVHELARVCRRGGAVVMSTPNRITFSPGLGRREKPANVFHCREYDAAELTEAVSRWAPALEAPLVLGLHHGPRLRQWEALHGSLVAAQLAASPHQWSADLASFVASIGTADFELSHDALDTSLDLVAVAGRPS